jgi:hypothetical protein
MRTSNAITKIIESCLDDERTLVQQGKLVGAEKSAVLARLADERRRFSKELERLTRPVTRGHTGSWYAIASELVQDVWIRLWGFNVGDAVATCRRSQRRIDSRYERALELEWPMDLRATLEAQHERIHAARRALAMLEY